MFVFLRLVLWFLSLQIILLVIAIDIFIVMVALNIGEEGRVYQERDEVNIYIT
jgi:hypothetical protein